MPILVLCTGNSCRSQMAHGFLQAYLPEDLVYSAGTKPHGVHPMAIEVMGEAGIDISHHTSNSVDEYYNLPLDTVITVCDNAKESCPIFPGTHELIHHSFSDPADAKGTREEVLEQFRAVRDEIDAFCHDFAQKR